MASLSLKRRVLIKSKDYIAFGPHGPRQPLMDPGSGTKVFGGVVGVLAVSTALFLAIRGKGECQSAVAVGGRKLTDLLQRRSGLRR